MQGNRRNLFIGLGALLFVLAAAFGMSLTRTNEPASKEETKVAGAPKEAIRSADCASEATYDRLKQVVFEEAVRVRNADPANLDKLAASAVVRMEDPVVKSRDEELNVTVCSGRFVLELPPGAERAFNGERRLMAEVEYAAQASADGSGTVYQLNGAEPIIYRLASFDLQNQQKTMPVPLQPPVQTAEAEVPPVVAAPAPRPKVEPRTEPALRPLPGQRAAPASAPAPTVAARPSFNCRYARTRGERMVCGSSSLAAKDRAMSSLFYSALSGASPSARRALRSTRDRFLAYRDRCGSEACVSQAYDGRMQEIRDILAN